MITLLRNAMLTVPRELGLPVLKLWERKANNFFAVFSSFELVGITRHLMTGPVKKSEFCFPSTAMFPAKRSRKKHRGSRGNKTHCFPCGQSLSA